MLRYAFRGRRLHQPRGFSATSLIQVKRPAMRVDYRTREAEDKGQKKPRNWRGS